MLSAVTELASVYAAWKEIDANTTMSCMIRKIRSTMSDRGVTNAAAVELEELEWGRNCCSCLHCNVHPLDSIAVLQALTCTNELIRFAQTSCHTGVLPVMMH